MKKVYAGDYSFTLADWQQSKRHGDQYYTVTVAKHKHDHTDQHVNLRDSKPNTKKTFEVYVEARRTAQRIMKEDEEVLIHCAAGISRTPAYASIVAYYLTPHFESLKESRMHIEQQYPQSQILPSLWEGLTL